MAVKFALLSNNPDLLSLAFLCLFVVPYVFTR